MLALLIGLTGLRAFAAEKDDEPENPYAKAAAAIVAVSPAGSNLEYPAVPPYGADWEQIAEESWTKNAAVFPIVREARNAKHVNWPHGIADGSPFHQSRNLANVVGDAALYQHFHGDDHAAVELVRDVLAMSLSLRSDLEHDDMSRMLVSIGTDALVTDRLMTVITNVHLSDDPADAKALQTVDARQLIKNLIDGPSCTAALEGLLQAKRDPDAPVGVADIGRVREQANRSDSERAMTAMTLACHVFQHQRGRWPATLDELATQLPRVPVDPWGDGKQTFGYLLVKADKPDEPERPLVYSRCESQDGLFYRADRPQISFYPYTELDNGQRKRGGQFRDVTLWQPHTGLEGVVGPTTRPVN